MTNPVKAAEIRPVEKSRAIRSVLSQLVPISPQLHETLSPTLRTTLNRDAAHPRHCVTWMARLSLRRARFLAPGEAL